MALFVQAIGVATRPAAAAPPAAAAAAALPAMADDVVDTNPKEVPEYSYVLEDDFTNPSSDLAALGNGAFSWAACAWPVKAVFVLFVCVCVVVLCVCLFVCVCVC